MKFKILYLVFFIIVIWLGMTKTGRNLLSLSDQTETYTEKHNEYTIRFFAQTTPPLAATIKPAKLGLVVNPGQKASMEFTISNMSNEEQEIEVSEQITPDHYKSHLQLEPIQSIKLPPKGHHKLSANFILDSTVDKSIDTFHLRLHIKAI